jgi:type I restriction enzyme R subunit
MKESVEDEITVRIIYEGRAAKVLLDNTKLRQIEEYYDACVDDGANEYQIEESKKATTNMNVILSDPQLIRDKAIDFVNHYETRIEE